MLVGIFYGTNTGLTEIVCEQLADEMKKQGFEIKLHDIASVPLSEAAKFDKLILASPTWNDGELQDDWEVAWPDLESFDFTGKTVAFLGMGDQEGYCDNYLDAIGRMAVPVRRNGGKVVGRWSSKGYVHTHSVADEGDGFFVGLALDNDNQEDQTPARLEKWVAQLKSEF